MVRGIAASGALEAMTIALTKIGTFDHLCLYEEL